MSGMERVKGSLGVGKGREMYKLSGWQELCRVFRGESFVLW
jgi:hypothetical protein